MVFKLYNINIHNYIYFQKKETRKPYTLAANMVVVTWFRKGKDNVLPGTALLMDDVLGNLKNVEQQYLDSKG